MESRKNVKRASGRHVSSSDESSYDEESNEEEGDANEKFEDINVEFEAEMPFEEDFHGIKQLLLNAFVTLRIDVSELCELIISQQNVGSTMKIADEKDSEVYGIFTALSFKKYGEKKCFQELQRELLSKANSSGMSEQLKHIFQNKNVAYLVNERFINLPGQIAVPFHKSLICEVDEAKKMDSTFDFDYLLLISKTLQPSNVSHKSSKKKKKTSNQSNQEAIEYTNFEDEVFLKASEFNFNYCVTEATGLAASGDWDFSDKPMNTYRTVIIIPVTKWSNIVKDIADMVRLLLQMSNQVINELFQQIIHSEEKIKERFQTLKKLNQAIQDNQLKLKHTRKETEVLLASLSATHHRCIQEEIELKWLSTREKILAEQKESSLKEKNDLLNQIKVLESASAEERLEFLSTCDEFLKEFDIISEDKSCYQDTRQAEMIELTKEHIKLLETIDSLQLENQKAINKKHELEEALKAVKLKKKQLHDESSEHDDEISRLKCLKSKLINNSENFELQRYKQFFKELFKYQSILTEINMVSEECCCLTKHCQQLSVELFQRQQLHIENRHPNPSSYKQQVFKDQSKDLKKARFICFGISNPSVSNASPQPLKKKRFNYPSNESSSKIVHSKWRVSAPTEDSLDLELSDEDSFMKAINEDGEEGI